jgi:hypothetical protein
MSIVAKALSRTALNGTSYREENTGFRDVRRVSECQTKQVCARDLKLCIKLLLLDIMLTESKKGTRCYRKTRRDHVENNRLIGGLLDAKLSNRSQTPDVRDLRSGVWRAFREMEACEVILAGWGAGGTVASFNLFPSLTPRPAGWEGCMGASTSRCDMTELLVGCTCNCCAGWIGWVGWDGW